MCVKLSNIGCALAIVGLASISAAAVAQPAGISSTYWNSNLPFNRCMDVASTALTELGFTNISRQTTAFTGNYGDYASQVICATAKGLIIVIVAGPDNDTTANHQQSITKKLQGGR